MPFPPSDFDNHQSSRQTCKSEQHNARPKARKKFITNYQTWNWARERIAQVTVTDIGRSTKVPLFLAYNFSGNFLHNWTESSLHFRAAIISLHRSLGQWIRYPEIWLLWGERRLVICRLVLWNWNWRSTLESAAVEPLEGMKLILHFFPFFRIIHFNFISRGRVVW